MVLILKYSTTLSLWRFHSFTYHFLLRNTRIPYNALLLTWRSWFSSSLSSAHLHFAITIPCSFVCCSCFLSVLSTHTLILIPYLWRLFTSMAVFSPPCSLQILFSNAKTDDRSEPYISEVVHKQANDAQKYNSTKQQNNVKMCASNVKCLLSCYLHHCKLASYHYTNWYQIAHISNQDNEGLPWQGG